MVLEKLLRILTIAAASVGLASSNMYLSLTAIFGILYLIELDVSKEGVSK